MKIVTKTTPRMAFHYRGTRKSRERMREMAFCKQVEDGDHGIWVTDKSGDRCYAGPGDWIIVELNLVLDVLDEAMFDDQYTVVGEAI